MFSGLEVYSPQLSIPVLGPDSRGIDWDQLQIRNIDGLGPVKASVNTSPYAEIDGESFSGALVGKRNIVITFGFNPDYHLSYSMSGLRRLLYRYFMPKSSVTLKIFDNEIPTTEITGIVESVEPTIFAKDPEMQVSVICPKADFIASVVSTVTGTVSDGTAPETIDYVGNIPTGFVLKVEANGEHYTYTGLLKIIAQSVLPEVFTTTVAVDLDNHYEMSSVKGGKYARKVESATGAITNQFAKLSLDSVWPQLYPGDNQFAVISELGFEGQDWELTYYARFGGL